MTDKTRSARKDYESLKYSSERRAKALEKGLCGSCRKRPRDSGMTSCSTCRHRINANRSRRGPQTSSHHAPSAAWCIECQASGFHRAGCPATAGATL